MGFVSELVRVCVVVGFLICLAKANEDVIKLSKAWFKVNVVRDGEKVNQVVLSTTASTLTEVASGSGFKIEEGQSISVQAAFVDGKSNVAYVEQMFLRFVNERTNQDNVYMLKRKGKDMKLDLSLKSEIKADLEFWKVDDLYRVEMIMGDLKLDKSATWTVTEKMGFEQEAKGMFVGKEKNVFDFDVGVKKELLPEFEAPVKEKEKRAPLFAIVLGMIAVILPLPLLIVGWVSMGVFPLKFPEGKGERAMIFGFELCLLGHIVALIMFWVKWNIVTTWKVMGVIMVPTVLFGRRVLGERGAQKL